MWKILIVVASLLVPFAANAEVFTWKDEKGNVHFGDRRSNSQNADIKTVTIHDKYAIPKVKDLTPISYQLGQPNRTINFSAIILGLENSDNQAVRIGAVTCGKAVDFYWEKGVVDLESPEIADASVRALKQLGYQAENGIGRPVQPAQLSLVGKIEALKMNLCPSNYSHKVTQNETYVKMQWALSDPISGEVIYTGSSSGHYDAYDKPARSDGTSISLSQAIAAATRNLLADTQLAHLLAPANLSHLTEQFDKKMELNLTYGIGDNTFSKKAEHLKRNSVIVSTPNGHGSGVVINKEGYILTNAHVVGDNTTFTILAGNRTFRAALVRKEKLRDVALIRAEGTSNYLEGVELADSMPGIGTGLYVIGAPLNVANSQTITKGIVSAMRQVDGLTYIQTDAAINFGNSGGPVFSENGELIALTVAGTFTRDGANLSINYLIPIEDALAKLAIIAEKSSQPTVEVATIEDKSVSLEERPPEPKLPSWLAGIYHWLDAPLLR